MGTTDGYRVFLNVPFDDAYEPLFCALVTTVVALRGRPRSVLDVAHGSRLDRLAGVIADCDVSFHDLSRAENRRGVPRFNMPFELGLAIGRATWSRTHRAFLLEAKAYRLQKTLSDVNGLDPRVHRGTPRGMVGAVLDCLGEEDDVEREDELQRLARDVLAATRAWKRGARRRSVFDRTGFATLVALATRAAADAGLGHRRRRRR